MSSTSINIGISEDNRVSSRVLKPPGGGHSNIFGPPEENKRAPRSKNNQQNSTMMGEIMGKPGGESKGDPMSAPAPVSAATPTFEDAAPAPVQAAEMKRSDAPFQNSTDAKEYTSTRGRVPPGGFSAGLW